MIRILLVVGCVLGAEVCLAAHELPADRGHTSCRVASRRGDWAVHGNWHCSRPWCAAHHHQHAWAHVRPHARQHLRVLSAGAWSPAQFPSTR
jgi:hypothetical protein